MCQRSGLQNVLLVVISSLLLLAFVVGIVTVPAQAQQTSLPSVQIVATANPQAPPTVGPTATAVQNQHRAQQGKQQLGNAPFWSSTTLILILVGCAVLLAALSGVLAWSRKRPGEYKTLREKAGRLLRRLAHANWKVAAVGLGLLLAAALGVDAPLLGVKIPMNQPLLRLAAAVLGAVILVAVVVRGLVEGKPPPHDELTGHELPSAFVPRPTQLAQLRAALVDEKGRRKDLGAANVVVSDVEDGRRQLATLLRDQACLVVVDGVWEVEDAKAFTVVGPELAWLITTRDKGLAQTWEAQIVEVNELDPHQSLALLAARAGCAPTSLPVPVVAQVADEVGHLALGLEVAGSLAADVGWEHAFTLLRRTKLAIDISDRVSDDYLLYRNLQAAIQASIDVLPDPPSRPRRPDLESARPAIRRGHHAARRGAPPSRSHSVGRELPHAVLRRLGQLEA